MISLPLLWLAMVGVCCWYLRSRWKADGKGNPPAPPEAGGKWPVIGHLHIISRSKLPHVTFAAMADKYGPIFGFRFGFRRAVMVSSWEIARECFTVHDMAISSRPKTVVTEYLAYDNAMFAFVPYGPYWREVRKIATLELLSARRLELLRHVRAAEVNAMVKDLYQLWDKSNRQGVSVDMKERFGDLTMSISVRMVVGKRYRDAYDEEALRWKKALGDFLRLTGQFIIADAIPFLRWLDIGGFEKALKELAAEVELILESWLQEHIARKRSGKVEKENDFMDVMLAILDGVELGGHDAGTITKATSLAMISGGNDTSMVVLTWALSLLLNNPHAMKKAQDELDLHVGRERLLQESDIGNLEYIQAITKETLRLYPAGTLGGQRVFGEDCVVGGCLVPKGTMLLLNLWRIHRDPRVWENPLEFQPERFLTTHKDIDVRGKHFQLIPFGGGRRVCPGISFALLMVNFALASVLHAFDFCTPTGEAVDMSETFGMTNAKTTPLEVMLSPRLPSHLYTTTT